MKSKKMKLKPLSFPHLTVRALVTITDDYVAIDYKVGGMSYGETLSFEQAKSIGIHYSI